MKHVVYQPLRTPQGCYIYDRSVDTIFAVPESEYTEFKQLRNCPDPCDSPIVQHYRQRGLLRENNVKVIRHPSTDALPHYCSDCLSSMILQVTQQCNLRCKYCAYSGAYYNRTHNSARMSFETAKQAIDFLLARSHESDHVHVGFYGGEPLLEFDLIKRCVDYIKKSVEGRTVTFGITTNATLLNDEKIRFLAENDVELTISIDGSKEEHDACRVFPDGSGSYDIVMHNIRRLIDLYPDYANRMMISTVVSPRSDLNHVLKYFHSSKAFFGRDIIMTPLVDVGLKKRVYYQDDFFQIRKFEYLKFLLSMLGKIDQKYVSPLVKSAKQDTEKLYRQLQKHNEIPASVHHGGPCIPGIRRMFVMTDGTILPCEKISQSIECSRIGSVETGFNLQNMEWLMNIGSMTEDACKDCWALSHCRICAAQIDYKGKQHGFTQEQNLTACEKSKSEVMADLYEMCVLHEFGYRLNEERIIL